MTHVRRRRTHAVPLVLSLLALAPRAGAQSPSAPMADAELAASVDRIAGAYAALGRFSGAVVVARGGREVLARGYGRADRERGLPNTPDTRFDLGSLAKQFTAAAILKLEAEGKLSVSDPISRHLPDYPRPVGDRVTLHHLLTHTSGIPSLGRRGPLQDVEEDCTPKTLDELIAFSKDLPLQSEPGAQYRYSNTGYMMLAAVVERVSGMPFHDYLRTALFEPAGMQGTGPVMPDAAADGLAKGYEGYAPDIQPARCVHPTWQTGAGGLRSTARDLLRWDRALAEGRVLPPAQLAKLVHPHVGRGRPGAFYAYGWFVHPLHGRTVVNHGGTTAGFVSEMYRFAGDSVTVIVLSNLLPTLGVNVPAEVGERASALALGVEPDPPPPTPVRLDEAALRRVEGTYEVAPGYRVRVGVEDGRLIATALGDSSWSLSTIAAQRALNRASDTVATGMRILDAFARADVAALRAALKPERQAQVRDSSLMFVRLLQEHDPRFGRLLKSSAYRVVADRNGGAFVDARMSFEKSDWFVRAELDANLRLQGWYFGSTLPARVELVPTAPGRFFADGFRWEEADLPVRFEMEGGRAVAMVIEDPSGPVRARRVE